MTEYIRNIIYNNGSHIIFSFFNVLYDSILHYFNLMLLLMMILNDQLRSKHAAPSTLGKSVLIAWESVLSQRLAAVRGDGVLLALDEQGGATSQRPLAHGRHSRKVFIYSLFQSFVTAL